MVIKRPSFRINDESYNVLLNSSLCQNRRAKQRRFSNMYEGYSSAEFLQEEIQPKMRSGDAVYLDSEGIDRLENRSKALPKRCISSHHASGYIRQHTIQPSNVTVYAEYRCDQHSKLNESKKRPRSPHGQPEATITTGTEIEVRIGGGATIEIVNEIRTNLSSAHKESSIFFKGIRKLPTTFSDDENENVTKESLCLLNSLKDLIQIKGSSWKRIRIQECSPSLLELVLASRHCHNFEEVHILEMYDDDDDEDESKQMETGSAGSKCQSLTSSLIVSLLTNATQIRELVLNNCNLENVDLIRIMNIICSHPNHPTSLERLDLRFNKFTSIAIQSILTNHLRSSLHSLKDLKLRQGIRCFVHRNIRKAVLQSLRCNRVVLESIDVFDSDKSVQYLLDVNRAKRRLIFCNNDRFPRTLWPLLLEQALVANGNDEHDVLMRKVSSSRMPSHVGTKHRYNSSTKRQASVLYHIFRNGGPMLLEQQHPSNQPNDDIESN